MRLPDTHRTVLAAELCIGSRFESADDNGISHFLEHMLYRGTESHPSAHELALAFERHGGSLMATTSSDTGTLEVNIPPSSFDSVLPIFAEVFQAPAFSAIDTERGIVREEILEGLDDAGNCVCSEDLIRQLVFEGHALGRPISGTLRSLDGFSVEALRAHHRRYYCGANTVLAVAGPIDPERTLDQLEATFESLARGTVPAFDAPTSPRAPKFSYVSHRASQTEVRVGFRAPGFSSPDEPAMDLLSRVLDDGMATRLYHRLCDEKGLCYEVSGVFESSADSGILELSAETGHARVEPVLEELLSIVQGLKRDGPTEEELGIAKRRHRWQLEAMLDSPAAVAEFFLTEELFGTRRRPLERDAQLASITRHELRDTANRWFTRENLSVVLVGFLKKADRLRAEGLVQSFA